MAILFCITVDPVIKCFDYTNLVVLGTNFSSLGFGYVLLQPGNNTLSIEVMEDYHAGKASVFLTLGSNVIFHPVSVVLAPFMGTNVDYIPTVAKKFFGTMLLARANNTSLGIISFGLLTVTLSSLLYHTKAGIQIMHLICWDCEISHCPDTELVYANYWSHLGADLEYDPLYQ